MENLSEEELIKIYKALYFRKDCEPFIIDFESVVQSYRIYLSLFFDEESTFYQDFKFLSYAIGGFNYLYKDIFGTEEFSVKEITSSIHEHDSELRRKNQKEAEEEVEYTDDDAILVYLIMFLQSLEDNNLADEFRDLIQDVSFNYYVIRKETKKVQEQKESSGVVYWKHFNSQSKSNNLLS